MLLMARQCRSMRAHAARRPNVFVLGAKPLLQEAFAAASVRGTRSRPVGRFGGGVDASGASGCKGTRPNKQAAAARSVGGALSRARP